MWGPRCVVSVEEGGGRDEAGALILTQYGVPGAWSQPEEGDEAGALILNQKVPGACSEAGALILNQYGVPGACSRGPGWRNMGFQARGLSPKKAEVGTRPELGSQVRARQGRGRSAYPQPIWGPRCESGGGDEAVALILDQRGVPGTRSRPEEGEGGDEGGALILNRYGVLGACPTAACISARCLKPEEGELQEEATTSSKDLLSEYVLGAWSQPEEDRGGDKAGSPMLNCHGFPGSWSGENRSRDQAGVPILSQYGVPGARSQLEEDGGGNQAWKLKMKKGKDKVRILKKKKAGSGNEAVQAHLHGVPGTWCVVSVEEGGGRDEAGALILNQYGVPGAWSQPEEGDEAGALFLNQYVPGAKAEAGTRPERLSSTNVESQVRALGPKKVKVRGLERTEAETRMEAGTRPEHFSSTNIGSEVRGLNSNRKLKLKKTEVWKFKLKKTQAWKLKLKKGKDKVRILKKKKAGSGNEAVQARLHGVPGAWSQSKKAEAGTRCVLSRTRPAQYGVPGAWSQPEEGGGGDEAGAGVPGACSAGTRPEGTRPERLSSTNVESQVRDLGEGGDEGGALILNRYGVLGACPTAACISARCLKPEEGELQEEATTSSKDLLSEYVLGAWSQPEEDRGGDKAGSPILNCHGFPGSWSGENRSRDQAGVPILNQYGVPGARSQLEEDGGGNQAGALLLNQYRVRGAWSQLEQDGGEERKLKLKKTEVWKFKPKKTQAWKLKLKKGKDKVWKLKPKKTEARTIQGMEACVEAHKSKKTEARIRCVKKKKAGSGNEAVQARLHGVPGAWSQSKKAEAGTRPAQYGVPGAWSQPEEGGGGDEAGTRPERLSSTNVESQVRDLGPKKVKVGCLKPEEGELQEEATTSSKDLLSEYVLGAWSQPEEDRGGDKAGVPILNQYGVPGARSQLEEDGGGNQDGGEERPECLSSTKIGKLKLKKTEVWKFKLKKTQAWKLKLKKGKDKVRILKKKKAGSGNEAVQARLHGAWSQPEEGDETGALILNQYVPGRRNMGFQARGLSPKKAEAGTRAELGCESGGGDEAGALILDQRGVPGTRSRPEEGEGGDEGGALILNRYGVLGARPTAACISARCLKPEEGELQEEATTGSKDLLSEYVLGAWSQPEEDGGGDKAGSPILNCHGFPGPWSGENRSRDQAGVPILKQYGVPGARSQLEEDGGGNQAGALVLNQYRVRGAWSQLEQDGGEERPEYLCKDKAGRAHPQPTWGSEVRKFKLKKTQVWKFKLKKTEAWKPKLKKGKDKAWKLKLKKGKNKAWKLKLKETEARTRQGQGREDLSSTNMGFRGVEAQAEEGQDQGVDAQAEEDRGKEEAWTLKRKKTEARRRPGVDAQAEEDGGKDEAWKLKRKKTEARTRRTLKETESPKASHGECKEYARYLGIDPGYEGEETHNAMLCPSLGRSTSEES
ncbi:unnamed protein product [Symbiodinium sp. CCMP2592]|nr:unnamed protein product [Symbiodinium sp. CCMP2592]